jgi:hypothetical protein
MRCENCGESRSKITEIARKSNKQYVIYKENGVKKFTSANNYRKLVEMGAVNAAEAEVHYLG